MDKYGILGAAGFGLWGILHLFGGGALLVAVMESPDAGFAAYAGAARGYDALAGAILAYFAYGIAVLGAVALAVAVIGNRRNSERALMANTVLVGGDRAGIGALSADPRLRPHRPGPARAGLCRAWASWPAASRAAGREWPMARSEARTVAAAQAGDRRAFDALIGDAMPCDARRHPAHGGPSRGQRGRPAGGGSARLDRDRRISRPGRLCHLGRGPSPRAPRSITCGPRSAGGPRRRLPMPICARRTTPCRGRWSPPPPPRISPTRCASTSPIASPASHARCRQRNWQH